VRPAASRARNLPTCRRPYPQSNFKFYGSRSRPTDLCVQCFLFVPCSYLMESFRTLKDKTVTTAATSSSVRRVWHPPSAEPAAQTPGGPNFPPLLAKDMRPSRAKGPSLRDSGTRAGLLSRQWALVPSHGLHAAAGFLQKLQKPLVQLSVYVVWP
jgi:hypothetical protein